MPIKYESEFFDLLNDLTKINKKLIIDVDKENHNIVISRKGGESLCAYIMKAPLTHFDIDESIAIYRYDEFYRFLKMFKNPELYLDLKTSNKLTIKGDYSRFDYILGNPATLEPGPKVPKTDGPNFKFDLSSESLTELIKMHNLIKDAEYSSFTCSDNSIKIKIFMSEKDNTFEQHFHAENFGYEGVLKFNVFSDFFEMLPSRRDYVVSIMDPGFLIFTLQHEEIDLNIYTSRTIH